MAQKAQAGGGLRLQGPYARRGLQHVPDRTAAACSGTASCDHLLRSVKFTPQSQIFQPETLHEGGSVKQGND